ncbi:SLC13 family permease [Arthrobacter celericrescens]|uniref:SLC13 family permease n=1 Tax=Arthrobacter celericrescens TaxID=2320851 RepID=UPI000EA29AFC|nr:SLC13 family permease [Arthrobacter celericrescens]
MARTWLTNVRGYLLPTGILLAGVVCLATGFLSGAGFQALALRTAPILLFVVAMTVVTELVSDAGLFQVVTDRIAGLGRGRVWLLWLLIVALATASTVFLSLDTTAVLVTPLVVLLAVHAGIPPLPFALTTVWLANTASLILPVSNLTNLLAQNRLAFSPLDFAKLVWAPSLVGVLVPLLILGVAFRKQLRGRYGPQPRHQVMDRPLLVVSAVVLVLLLPALVSGIPVQFPALAAAIILLTAYAWKRPSTLKWSMIPWRPLMLTVGLFMVVEALHENGLGALLARAAGDGEGFPALLQLAGAGALAANAANNLPAYLALEPVAGSPTRLAALLIGVNLGPLVTPWASLATLLWHERLQALNVSIRWSGFALAGLVAVVLVLPAAVLLLWVSSGMP